MKKENRNMYKLGFAETLLSILYKLDILDVKLRTRIKNKTVL